MSRGIPKKQVLSSTQRPLIAQFMKQNAENQNSRSVA